MTLSSLTVKDGAGNDRSLKTVLDTENRHSVLHAAFNVDRFGRDLFAADISGRLRSSVPVVVFDSKAPYDKDPRRFAEWTANSGAVTHLAPDPSILLTTAAAAGSSAVRQTRCYFDYTGGAGFQVLVGLGTMHSQAGHVKRAGYFDANDGIFLESTASELALVVRSNITGAPSDTRIAQNQWNVDHFDGNNDENNPSGVTFAPQRVQELVIDFSWPTGQVAIGFTIGGVYHPAHLFDHANASSSPYMATPNLPVRWEITGDGGSTGQLRALGCRVIREGGTQKIGATVTVDREGTAATTAQGAMRPILSVRLRAGRRNHVVLQHISIVPAAGLTKAYRWAIMQDPTVEAGGTAADWTPEADSSIDYDTKQDAQILSGNEGRILASGYAHDGQINFLGVEIPPLTAEVDGTPNVVTLGIQLVDSGSQDILAAMQFSEQM